MSQQVIIDRVVSRIRTVDGAGGLSAETLRSIIEAVLPAVEAMLAHHEQIRRERSTANGYLDWIDQGGER
ncbi:hypothetical protein [Chitinimonas lacunae]|uniref:Uncharacterized protein n=1 Tax=Chitinimonas lacunae TaxID=1963018 RepID=A0ABV8MKG4_9NEIS